MNQRGEPFAISFDRAQERSGVKWSRYGPDVLSAWVADMDYNPPEAVTAALRRHLDHGDLGYGMAATRLAPAYAEFQQRHHSWRPDVELIRTFTSALHALETVLWHCSQPGDGVVVFTPIYHPFLGAIDSSGRRRVDVQLEREGWRIDPERLDAAIDDTTRIILFCNPHNPTGRVFDAEEVAAVADVAERHDLLVVTDEIWGELTHERTHRPLALCDDRFAGRLITLGSASKSFNLAGLRCAVAHIDHEPLRTTLDSMPEHLLGATSVLGAEGTLAAWTACDDWLGGVRREVTARRDQLAARLASDAPQIRFDIPEATYLGWMDFGATALGDDPSRPLFKQHGVALSSGLQFGSNGASFARINFATSAEILDAIIDRIVTAVSETPSEELS